MRRLIMISAFVATAIIAIVVIATPWLLSSDIVKERIAHRIEELTGLKTTLRGTPVLTLVPFLGIKLSDVVVKGSGGEGDAVGDEPLVSMDALKGQLKLFPAIFGTPELANFKLVRPKFNLKVSRAGNANWHSKSGALSQLLSAAIDSKKAKSNHLRSIKLASFEIINGTINYQNDRLGQTNHLTSVNVELTWPDTNARAEVIGSMVWRGENVKISVRIDQPINLLSGAASDILLDIRSNPLNARIEGNADMNLTSQFSGTAEISSPSVRQYLAWTGYDLAPGSTPGALKINSNIIATSNTVKFQGATVSLDGNIGTGFMELSLFKNKRPGLAGTLAFQSLSFDPYFQALIKDGDTANEAEIAKIGLIDEFNLDLRFSANTATLSNITLTSMAATVQIRDSGIILDIGEASLFGGMVQSQLQASKIDGVPTGEVKLNLIDIEMGQLSKLIAPEGIDIAGKGTASLILKSRGRNASQLIQRLNGSATIAATSGHLEGINIAEIAIDGESEIILDNTKVLSKQTDFTNLNIGMHIANGIAILDDSKIEGEGILAKFGGKADLWRGSLAMNGQVLLSKSGIPEKPGGEEITHNIPFFVGGTFGAPLFASDIFSNDSGKGR